MEEGMCDCLNVFFRETAMHLLPGFRVTKITHSASQIATECGVEEHIDVSAPQYMQCQYPHQLYPRTLYASVQSDNRVNVHAVLE